MATEREKAEPSGESGPASKLEFRRALWKQSTKIIIDSLYSARSHQKAAAIWVYVGLILGLPASLVTALSAAGAAITALLGKNPSLTAGLAIIAAVLSSARAFLRPEETLKGYENKGAAYLALRNDASHFRDVLLLADNLTEEELRSRLEALHSRRNALNGQPPLRVPTWAYRMAKKSIDAGESGYENDPLWQNPPF